MSNVDADPYRAVAWDLYFSTVIGWAQHPGYLRENAPPPPTEAEAALKADRMLAERDKRFPRTA